MGGIKLDRADLMCNSNIQQNQEELQFLNMADGQSLRALKKVSMTRLD